MKRYFATCPPYFEDLLLKEAASLELQKTQKKKGGVEFSANAQQALGFILHTRLAARVSLELGTHTFSAEKAIYQAARKNSWAEILRADENLKIQTILAGQAKRAFKNSVYLSQLIKDAICDDFREAGKPRPTIELKNPQQTILAVIEEIGKAKYSITFSLDLTGRPLHERGYRSHYHDAPIKENLAAALLMSTDWDPSNEALVNPMCGSGTFLIEAALIQTKLPPTILKLREYKNTGRSDWSFLNSNAVAVQLGGKEFIHEYINRLLEKIADDEASNLFGFDIDPKAFEATRQALTKLPQLEDIRISKKDFFGSTAPSSKGVVIINPPYGHRLEADRDFYYNLGEHLKNEYKGFRVYLLCPDQELRKVIRLKTSQKLPFRNGKLECRLLKYELY